MGETRVDPAEKRGFSSWWWWRFRDVAMGWMKYKIGVTNKYIEWARQRQTMELPDFQACNDNKCNGAFFSCPTMLPDVGHKIDMVLHHHVTNKVSDATRLPTAPLLFCPTLFPAVQHTFVTQGWNMLKDWDKTRGEDEKRKRKAKNKVPRSKKDKK